eukprot:767692-Hanusia_phi.AAC.3
MRVPLQLRPDLQLRQLSLVRSIAHGELSFLVEQHAGSSWGSRAGEACTSRPHGTRNIARHLQQAANGAVTAFRTCSRSPAATSVCNKLVTFSPTVSWLLCA